MKTQEALTEIEKMVRMWKAVEKVSEVMKTVSAADNHVSELSKQKDTLVDEVASLKASIEVAKAGLVVEKEEAGKIIASAKLEADKVIQQAKDKASAMLTDASLVAQNDAKQAEEYLSSLREDKVQLEAKKATLAKEVKDLEKKYEDVKHKIASLLK